ncbi:MAG: hybrid sensor histidine kinase/response regulator [Candidatus Electryonea clarkiae]|nr:hybrid sensor histidine kinase/response regulator [Candidatus Electryonea clarkiae]
MQKKPLILIVDDNELNRILLNDLVVALGYKPLLAINGAVALKLMETQIPDIVLLDILMPELDGYGVLDRMKSSETLRHTPVIMITAIDDIESAARCIEKGADDYMTKPFNSTLLKARIVGSLEKKRLRDSEQLLHKELKESFESLQRAENARDALSHMIVHDLNAPLTVMMGFTNLLQYEVDNEEIDQLLLQKYYSKIEKSIVEMSSLVKGILDVSKLENGEMSVSMGKFDVVPLFWEQIERFTPPAKDRGIQLSFVSEEKKIFLNADKTLLSRVLDNLITNALKHTGANTSVTGSVIEDDNSVILTIKDNGPGIPEEYIDKVFDKFFQIEARSKGKKYGVGLGLAFCKLAVEAQNGKIWVESTEREGSCFNMAFETPGK